MIAKNPGCRLLIASDHAGFSMKTDLCCWLQEDGYEFSDLGTDCEESVDYPDCALPLVQQMEGDGTARGILLCGTGIGISIAANRHSGIRAALCHDATTARLSRQHNDANVLVLGARVVGIETARDIVRIFLTSSFDNVERHRRRVVKLG